MNALETNMALDRFIIEDFSLCRLRVDLRPRIKEFDDIRASTLRRGDIGHEGENVAGLDGTESRALKINHVRTPKLRQAINTDHETNEEFESGGFPLGNEDSSVPENECDDEEYHRLRKREEGIAPNSSAVRLTERFLQALAVQSKAVFFPGEGSDGTNGSSGFTSQLSGVFMGYFVSLILQYDDSLHGVVSGFAFS